MRHCSLGGNSSVQAFTVAATGDWELKFDSRSFEPLVDQLRTHPK